MLIFLFICSLQESTRLIGIFPIQSTRRDLVCKHISTTDSYQKKLEKNSRQNQCCNSKKLTFCPKTSRFVQRHENIQTKALVNESQQGSGIGRWSHNYSISTFAYTRYFLTSHFASHQSLFFLSTRHQSSTTSHKH